jgi:nucleolar protein 14
VTAYPDLQGSGIELSVSPSAALAPHEPADLAQIFELGVASSSQEVEQGKADVLAVAFRLVQTFARLYGASEAFIELFTPISSVLEGSRVAKLSPELKVRPEKTFSRALADTRRTCTTQL